MLDIAIIKVRNQTFFILSMFKKMILVVGVATLLSGCSVKVPINTLSATGGSLWKSEDGGDTFKPKVKVDEKRTIASADVLSLAIHPTNSDILYIGTMAGGLFRTRDAGEVWEPIVFPPTKNYGLAIDPTNGDHIYASGIYEEVGKIYRSDDAGANWKEVYTEPGKGTVVTALTIHPNQPNTLYAGTSEGVIIKSLDGGETWKNLTKAKGPVSRIFAERLSPQSLFAVIFNQASISSADGGNTWVDYATQAQQISSINNRPQGAVSGAEDPLQAGVFYVSGKNGLFRTADYGKTWSPINIIESAKKFPIRAIVVNPKNSNEISFASGKAFYKSNDGGVKWNTTQLEIDKGVSIIMYDPQNPAKIYFTTRKF